MLEENIKKNAQNVMNEMLISERLSDCGGQQSQKLSTLAF